MKLFYLFFIFLIFDFPIFLFFLFFVFFNFCHIFRDIKTSNFLYDKNYNIKVCDFGLSDLTSTQIQDLDGAKGIQN